MDEVQKEPENQTLEAPPTQNLNQAKPADTQPVKPKRKLPLPKILVAGIVILITLLAFGLFAYLVMGQNKAQENQITETQASAPTPTPDPTADWKTYSASYDSFSFKYPSDLEILEDKYNGKAFRTFIENGDIQLVIHPGGLTGESSLDAYRNNVEKVGANNFSSYKISGEEALKYNVIAKGEETIEIITIHNGKTYLITYSYANPEQVQYFDQILSTFKFTDANEMSSASDVDTSGWKDYDGPEFSFRYPPNYEIISDNNNLITLGIRFTKDEQPWPYLTISKVNSLDYSELKNCSQDQVYGTPCLTSISSGYQEEEIAETNLDTIRAVSFITTEGPDNLVYYVQTTENPSLELKMNVAGGGLGKTFEKILATFQFTD